MCRHIVTLSSPPPSRTFYTCGTRGEVGRKLPLAIKSFSIRVRRIDEGFIRVFALGVRANTQREHPDEAFVNTPHPNGE